MKAAGRRFRAAALVALAAMLGGFGLASQACDSEDACSGSCPTGTRFTNDGTCACEAFDAGYCRTAADCPDAFCPATGGADACGGGQAWSTSICGCYPLPDGGARGG